MTTTDDMREANASRNDGECQWRVGARDATSRALFIYFYLSLLFFFVIMRERQQGLETTCLDSEPQVFIFLSSFSLMPIIYRHDSDVFCDQQNGPRDFVNQCFIYLDFNNEIRPTQPQYYSIQLRIGHNASAREQRRGRWAVFRYYQDDIPLMTSKGPEGEQGRKGSW